MTSEKKALRDRQLTKLAAQVSSCAFKATAIKVELEGRIGRQDRCNNCPTSLFGEYHDGCKNFYNTKIANDFLLKQLSTIGLAERCTPGDSEYSIMWKPKYPCVFSKVYTDSETEWTITISLKEPENILLLPRLIDAFNALAKANGTRRINVAGSGMHMALLQGKNGIYPSDIKKTDLVRFDNFSKSMTPMLPALYLLGANRREKGGKVITRSFSPRQPRISARDKYSAVAYRYGALEFRVFDTCYDNREQILDNAAVMCRSVSKYWRKEYRSPGMAKYLTKPVYFGGRGSDELVQKIEDCFKVKEQIQLLNEGLKRIKPPYYTIREIKKARKFKKNGHNCTTLDLTKYSTHYDKYIAKVKWNIQLDIAREMFYAIDGVSPDNFDESQVPNIKRRITKKINGKYPVKSIEQVAYEEAFGGAFLIWGDV